jgi:hypothetical protein
MKLVQATLTVLLMFVVFTTTAQAEMSVARASICTSVAEREPVGAASSFANVERLYLFTEIIGAGENEVVQHVWYYKDEPLLEVDLTVNGPRWRTWSHKNIKGMKGQWRAEVVNRSGEVLRAVSFTIE